MINTRFRMKTEKMAAPNLFEWGIEYYYLRSEIIATFHLISCSEMIAKFYYFFSS